MFQIFRAKTPIVKPDELPERVFVTRKAWHYAGIEGSIEREGMVTLTQESSLEDGEIVGIYKLIEVKQVKYNYEFVEPGSNDREHI